MRKPNIVTIGDNEYRITAFDAFRQLKLFGDLQKEVLPAVGGVLNQAMSKGENTEADDRAGIEAFQQLSSKFDGAQLMRWADLLIDGEYVVVVQDGNPLKLSKAVREDVFTDFSEVLELLYHIGKVNFAAPLQRWVSLSGLALKLTEKLSASSAKTS